MKIKDKRITYFFQGGRKNKLLSNEVYAAEMFYGYEYFKKNNTLNLVEFKDPTSKLGILFFKLIEVRIRRLLSLPLYWSFVLKKENYSHIKNSDFVIYGNNRVACSILPFEIFCKLIKSDHKSLSFIMGLFAREPRFYIFKKVQLIYIKNYLKFIDYHVFLSKKELYKAQKKFPKYKNKFYFIPFGVDTEVWNNPNLEPKLKNEILFVGNDGFRDYELVEKLINSLPQYKFNIVSENINIEKLKKNNFTIYSGNWAKQAITDIQLRDLYKSCVLTVLPIKETLQPSGQSVTLQSIACGTPVLISKYKGFWDYENFKDNENIFFIEKNNLNSWINNIKKIINMDKEQYNKVSKKGSELIKSSYNLLKFSKKIEEILLEK